MSQTDLALRKLSELREVAPDDVDDILDGLATLFALRQDLSNPMFGAQVSYYEQPDGEWVEISEEEFPTELRRDNDDDIPPEIDQPWRWKHSMRRGKWVDDMDDDEVEHTFEFYKIYTEWERVDPKFIPGFNPDGPMQDDIETAREREEKHGEDWKVFERGDERVYERRELTDSGSLIQRRAIVFEPTIAEQPPDTDFWDPNKEEITTPEDYPMGTVNLIIPNGDEKEFGLDYTYDVDTKSSVEPARDHPKPHTYTPGWE